MAAFYASPEGTCVCRLNNIPEAPDGCEYNTTPTSKRGCEAPSLELARARPSQQGEDGTKKEVLAFREDRVAEIRGGTFGALR